MTKIVDLMQGMSVCHLRFKVKALEAIMLNGQPGSALRGALYSVLSDNFCSEPEGPHIAGHQERCPVCWLLAAEDPEGRLGSDMPRPLTIQPPLARTYHPGQEFSFGITLIGAAQDLMPYIARAVQRMGEHGVGQGRGHFKLMGIAEYNPLYDALRHLMNQRVVQKPTLQVTNLRIEELVQENLSNITIELLTPTRLIENKQLVKSPDPVVFMQRLVERCQRLATYYAEGDVKVSRDEWRQLNDTLIQHATTWTIAYNETRWIEAFSGSRRHQHRTPISGLVGTVRWEGNIGPAHRWLLWGQSLHVGKDAVKGNGWYRIKS